MRMTQNCIQIEHLLNRIDSREIPCNLLVQEHNSWEYGPMKDIVSNSYLKIQSTTHCHLYYYLLDKCQL